MPSRIDLSGQRFGHLTALKDSGERKHRHVVWECICDCGKKTPVISYNLRRGHTKSCGCYCKEVNTGNKHALKHGDGRPNSTSRRSIKLYMVWSNMKRRCFNLKNKAFKYYGARGISVCKKWKNDYLVFKNWALPHGYRPGLTIDRTNSDGNYTPENCQFISRSENSRKAGKKRKTWENKK